MKYNSDFGEEELEILTMVLFNETGMKRQDILDRSPWGMTKTDGILKQLLEKGALCKGPSESEQRNRGRSHLMYLPNAEYATYLGIEISTNYDRMALIDFRGNVIDTRQWEPSVLREDFLDVLTRQITEMGQLVQAPYRPPRGIGIGLHGIVDERKGLLHRMIGLPTELNINVQEELQDRLSLPVRVRHNSDLLFVRKFREAIGADDDCVIALNHGYGLGLGIYLNGYVVEGSRGLAGEIGHIPIQGNEEKCYCGQVGCLRTIASYKGIVRRALEAIESGFSTSLDADKLKNAPYEESVEHIIEQVNRKDPTSIRLIHDTGVQIGRTLATAVSLFNPATTIVYSALCRTGDVFTSALRFAVENNTLFQSIENMNLLFDSNDKFRIATGAALRALEESIGV